jgi:hypothetical protein
VVALGRAPEEMNSGFQMRNHEQKNQCRRQKTDSPTGASMLLIRPWMRMNKYRIIDSC